ncbi:MAG: hypothetical protein JXA33_07410 [Anaerolineae bacterium]|nr:hypothetical protein [Anaerolineae bacterium]
MSKESEQERLRRLREEQLSARDPHAKENARLRRISARHSSRAQRKVSLRSVLRDMPMSVWYTLAGLLGGILLALIMNAIVATYWPEATWRRIAAFVFVLAGLVIGRFLGKAMDWRNEDWDR